LKSTETYRYNYDNDIHQHISAISAR